MATREEKFWQHYREEKTQRQNRKEIKKNRKPGRVRERGWTDAYIEDPDGYDMLDVPSVERVMPRGEREQRRTNKRVVPAVSGTNPMPRAATLPAHAREMQIVVVIEVSTGLCRVALGEQILLCTLRGGLSARETGYTNLVAAGDEVMVAINGASQGIVEAVLPRRTVLARPDVLRPHLQQVMVANVEQLLIVVSWREPAIWPELVDRYLISAQSNGLQPIICVN